MKTLTAELDISLIDDVPTTAQLIKAHRRAQRKNRKLSFRKGERSIYGNKRARANELRAHKAEY